MLERLNCMGHSKTDVYHYAIKGLASDSCRISIEFLNGIFQCVKFPFSGSYTREQWEILAEIHSEIAKIESQIAESKGG